MTFILKETLPGKDKAVSILKRKQDEMQLSFKQDLT